MSEAASLMTADAGASVAKSNGEQALKHVERFRSVPLGHFIDGQPVQCVGDSFDVLDPSTGEVLGQAAAAGRLEDVDAAVADVARDDRGG